MKLKVRVINPLYEKRHLYASYVSIPEYNDYVGELLPPPKRNPDNVFRLKDLHSRFVREIPKDWVICGWKY
jgi:hypothetical protein